VKDFKKAVGGGEVPIDIRCEVTWNEGVKSADEFQREIQWRWTVHYLSQDPYAWVIETMREVVESRDRVLAEKLKRLKVVYAEIAGYLRQRSESK
jgi:hypothetical protein